MWDTFSRYGDVLYQSDTAGNALSFTLAGGMLISQHDATDTSYFLADALGSTRALTHEAGSISSAYDYDAFGELTAGSNSVGTDYLFTGQQYDASTELYNLRARYYSPSMGRFLSQDTWATNFRDPMEYNRYVYAANNPATLRDPSGQVAAATTFSLNRNSAPSVQPLTILGRWINRAYRQVSVTLVLAMYTRNIIGPPLNDLFRDSFGLGHDFGKTLENLLRRGQQDLLNRGAIGSNTSAESISDQISLANRLSQTRSDVKADTAEAEDEKSGNDYELSLGRGETLPYFTASVNNIRQVPVFFYYDWPDAILGGAMIARPLVMKQEFINIIKNYFLQNPSGFLHFNLEGLTCEGRIRDNGQTTVTWHELSSLNTSIDPIVQVIAETRIYYYDYASPVLNKLSNIEAKSRIDKILCLN